MKKNLNVIQIKGFRGILYIAFIGLCLAAGFGWFPGWLCMQTWNLLSGYFVQIPAIGIIQGMLLWAIISASYFTFRKDRLVVCMKASEGLSEEELKEVFADMKKHAQQDTFLKDLIKAQEAELRIRNLTKTDLPKHNINNENKEKVESK